MSSRRDVLLALPLLGAGWAGLQQVIASPSPAATASAPAATMRVAAHDARPRPGATGDDARRREAPLARQVSDRAAER
jgi:hypothetical protein